MTQLAPLSLPAKVPRGTAEDYSGVFALFQEGTQTDAGEEGCDRGS